MRTFAALVASLLTDVLYGWVVSLLWRWFITPLGVRPIGVAHGIGLAIMVSLLTKEEKEAEDVDVVKTLSFSLTASAAALVTGFAVHLFSS